MRRRPYRSAGLVMLSVPLGCLLATQPSQRSPGPPLSQPALVALFSQPAAASAAPSPTVSAAPSQTPGPAPSQTPGPAPSQTPGPAPSQTLGAAPSEAASAAASQAGFPAAAQAGNASGRYWPVTLTIQTVPALADVHFTFDGKSLVTGANGQVSYAEQHNFDQHTLTLTGTAVATRFRHYRFTRWAGERHPDEAFRTTVSGLPMRASYTVTAAFTAQCPVEPRFTDQHGKLLDARRISRVTLKSSAGRQVNIPAGRTSWLDCVQPVYRDSTLISHNMRYAVQAVMFASTNIVYAGVERFTPRDRARPTFVGYFHNLTVTAHDALFGGRTGGVAVVTLPSHAVRQIALGPGHAATLDNLPQGDYQVNVRAAGAIVSADSFRLSKTKAVDLTAVSAIDLATIGGGLLLAAAGLPLLTTTRRRRLLDHLRSGQQHRPKGSPA